MPYEANDPTRSVFSNYTPEIEKETPRIGKVARDRLKPARTNVLIGGEKIGQRFDINKLLEVNDNGHLIVSPTGSGKTFAALENPLTIVLVPYRPLAKSTALQYGASLVIGKSEIDNGADRFVCTYDSVDRLAAWLDRRSDEYPDWRNTFTLVVDEWHQSIYSAGYRKKAIKKVVAIMEEMKNVWVATATPLWRMPGTKGFSRVDFVRDVAHTRNVYFGAIDSAAKAVEEILKINEARGRDAVVVVLRNNRNKNKADAKMLVSRGWGTLLFDASQKGEEAYQNLTKTQKLKRSINALFVTALWQDGHNVYTVVPEFDAAGRHVVLLVIGNQHGGFGAAQIEQAASRIRDAASIDVVLSMDEQGGGWVVDVCDDPIRLTGDKDRDVESIFNAMLAHAADYVDAALAMSVQTLKHTRGKSRKDAIRTIIYPLTAANGLHIEDVEGEISIEVDGLMIRHNAQVEYDRACWANPDLIMKVLNDTSQSIYYDRGEFGIKAALSKTEEDEFDANLKEVKAEQKRRRLGALEDMREMTAIEIDERMTDPEASLEAQEMALYVMSCINLKVEKDSAIDLVSQMGETHAMNFANIKKRILTPLRYMKMRKRKGAGAAKEWLTKWSEGDAITSNELQAWADSEQGRKLLTTADDDPDSRLAHARQLLKQGYGAAWANGVFVIKNLDPLVDVVWSKPDVEDDFGEVSDVNDVGLIKKLRNLAGWAAQSESETLNEWLNPRPPESEIEQMELPTCEAPKPAPKPRPCPLNVLRNFARAKISDVNKPMEGRAQVAGTKQYVNVEINNGNAAHLADVIESIIEPQTIAKKPKRMGGDEVKVLAILKRKCEPLTISQIRKKSGGSKRRMSNEAIKGALANLMQNGHVQEVKGKRSAKYTPLQTVN